LTCRGLLAVKVDLESALSITKGEMTLSAMLHMTPKSPCEVRSDAIVQIAAEEMNCSPARHKIDSNPSAPPQDCSQVHTIPIALFLMPGASLF
jgi:hypothetical protein